MNNKKHKKTALIMEGGAMRGMVTCGVIDVIMEMRRRYSYMFV